MILPFWGSLVFIYLVRVESGAVHLGRLGIKLTVNADSAFPSLCSASRIQVAVIQISFPVDAPRTLADITPPDRPSGLNNECVPELQKKFRDATAHHPRFLTLTLSFPRTPFCDEQLLG